MTVIEHDFGLAKRLTERRFGKLLELDALHEANIRANPLPYLERASERIFRLRAAMFEAIQAGRPATPGAAPGVENVLVDKAEYQRLKTCLALLEKAYVDYGALDEEA
ncbi:MAG TPA: hypothetical protein VIF34_04860 [Methylocystis sp.]|jgi:hypothetical protein